MRPRPILPLLLLLLGAHGCGEVEQTIEGHWTGNWTGGGASGSLQIDLGGSGDLGPIEQANVLMVVTGGTCVTEGDRASGSRSAAQIHGEVDFAVRFDGAPEGSDLGVYRFEGNLGGDAMSGTYRITSDSCPQCTCGMGSAGVWSVTR